MISVQNEHSTLKKVIIGRASPYQRHKNQVAAEMKEFPFIPNTDRKAEVLALTYPTEEILQQEYVRYTDTLVRHGVEVLVADPAAAYSFDYTCPRDIGFVIGDIFFIANMGVPSRTSEIKTIAQYLEPIAAAKKIRPPENSLVEGGDVIVLDKQTVLIGCNQRSNEKGFAFLETFLAPLGIRAIQVRHRQLHLDCCLNPLGRGHLLIHPDSLQGNDEAVWRVLKEYEWIQVDAVEREYLATNILSVDPDTIIARDHVSCTRVNRVLENLGYSVEAIGFDGVPATGGSFRCASLPLTRLDS